MKKLPGNTVCVPLLVLVVVMLVALRWRMFQRVEHGEYGFVMTLEYTGQQVAGLRALMSQQCWISSFDLPLAIVEPFSSNSLLCHSHQLWNNHLQGKTTVLFRDLFDIYHFNEHSYGAGNPVLVSWEEFLQNAPRKVVLVTIEDIHHPGCLVFHHEDMCKTKADNPSNKIFSGCNRTDIDLQTLSFLRHQNFHVVRNVCIRCSEAMTSVTPNIITRHIFKHDAKDVTVIFNKWRFSMKVTKGCKKVEICNEKTTLPHRMIESKRLDDDANWYLKNYFNSKVVISIMIRVEWHFITNRNAQHGRNDAVICLEDVLKAVAEVQRGFAGNTISSFVSMDVGTYGSGTFEHTIKKTNTSKSVFTDVLTHARQFVQELYRGTWTFNDWEESFLTIPGILADKGYIATLQRTIASKGDCLILMGGGHFQYMALQTYLSRHPRKEEQCVKYVCVGPAFQKLFNMN